jgi:hypothetical protein
MRPPRRDHSLEFTWRFAALSRALTIAGSLALCLCCSRPCLAQAEPSLNNELPPSQPELTRDEWRQRIEDARRRAKDAARERREHPELYMPVPEDPEIVATERVLNDESLQRGDIIATKRGMFVYQGGPEQPRREQDFVPIAPKTAR